MMFSRTLMRANGWVIWNVRTMPAAQIRCGARPVMSRPSSTMRPASGLWKPAMAANSVVLPAPLGPISPTISPARTSSDAWSTAFRPPNALERSRTSSMAAAPKEAGEAVGQPGDDDDQHHAVDDQAERLDVLERREHAGGVARQLVDRGQHDRADQRAEDGAGAADHRDQQHLDRLVDAEGDRRVDVEVLLGIEGAAGGTHRTRQSEHLHLLGKHIDAERARGILVLSDRDQAGAEAAAGQPPGDQQRHEAEREGEIVGRDRGGELEVLEP